MRRAKNRCDASNDEGGEPSLGIACASDAPTQKMFTAVYLLRLTMPQLKIRCVNLGDLTILQPSKMRLHGLPSNDRDAIFTTDKPIIFGHQGYPWLIHRLTYRRTNHKKRVPRRLGETDAAR